MSNKSRSKGCIVRFSFPKLKTLEWDILNLLLLLIWRLITRGEQALLNLKIKKKSGSSINPDIHHSKYPSSVL